MFTSLKSWQTTFEDQLNEVYRTVLEFLGYYKGFSEIRGRNLKEILDKPVKDCFLGGYKEKGYVENSFYNFCKDLYGIKLNESELAARLSDHGLFEASKYLRIEIQQTELVEKLKEFKKLYELARPEKTLSISSSLDVMEPSKLKSNFEELVSSMLGLSPNYNEYVFFLFRTYRIADTYLKQLYPDSEFPEIGSVLEYLQFDQIFDPGGPASEKGYKIFGYKEGSLGFRLLQLVDKAMDILALDSIRKYVKGLENERTKYLGKAGASLPPIDPETLDVIQRNSSIEYAISFGDYPFTYPKEWRVETPSVTLDNHKSVEYNITEVSNGVVKFPDGRHLTFEKFVDSLAPAMSLGLAWINPAGQNRINWGCWLPRR